MRADTISVAEASRVLGVRLDYVYRLLWDATLDGAKSEGAWRVKRESVRAYLKKRTRKNTGGRETDHANSSHKKEMGSPGTREGKLLTCRESMPKNLRECLSLQLGVGND